MTIELKEGALVCAGTLAVDDAEALLQMLQQRQDQHPGPAGPATDLSGCAHVHSACLQVLMAARVQVTLWPADHNLAAWLRAALD
jgi:ABC-type transporter Mla MlaB component